MSAAERVIVALDVPSAGEALAIVRELEGVTSFYKVGLELLMASGFDAVLSALRAPKRVFVDLKLPNDIPETVKRATEVAAGHGVSFLTLSNSVSPVTIRAAVAGRGDRPGPKLLYVSSLSSQDRGELAALEGIDAAELDRRLIERCRAARDAGADGFIVSGDEIALLRKHFPDAWIVSPGVRPAGSTSDDHKRLCTPAEAIARGADHIVIGRPIRNAKDRRAMAQSIVDEIASHR